MIDHRRINISDIAIGEPLAWDVYGEGKKLLLRRGQVIHSAAQVELLVERGLYIDAHHEHGAQAKPEAHVPKLETPSALRFINLAGKRLERLLYNLTNEADAQAKILEVAKALSHANDINADIALGSILLNQSAGHYAVRHGIDTALLTLHIARSMHKSDEETQKMMAAALTMNVGMLRQQDNLQNRLEPLSEKETETIRHHVQESLNLLQQVGIDDPDWLTYVRLHHENDDGSGYPVGKLAGELPQNAKIVAFADRYCACVVQRKYRKTLMPGPALREVLLVGGKPRDPLLAAYFIKELGAYPPGACVRLQNGEIGVVTRKGKAATTPIVHAFIGPRGAPLSFPIQRDTAKDLHAIHDALPGEQAVLRFSLQQLWGDEAAL